MVGHVLCPLPLPLGRRHHGVGRQAQHLPLPAEVGAQSCKGRRKSRTAAAKAKAARVARPLVIKAQAAEKQLDFQKQLDNKRLRELGCARAELKVGSSALAYLGTKCSRLLQRLETRTEKQAAHGRAGMASSGSGSFVGLGCGPGSGSRPPSGWTAKAGLWVDE